MSLALPAVRGDVTRRPVVAVGVFVDTLYEARDGGDRAAKELVIRQLTVLDWASDRDAAAERRAA